MSALGSAEVTAAPSTVKGLPRYVQTPAAPVAGREEGWAGGWEGVRGWSGPKRSREKGGNKWRRRAVWEASRARAARRFKLLIGLRTDLG